MLVDLRVGGERARMSGSLYPNGLLITKNSVLHSSSRVAIESSSLNDKSIFIWMRSLFSCLVMTEKVLIVYSCGENMTIAARLAAVEYSLVDL